MQVNTVYWQDYFTTTQAANDLQRDLADNVLAVEDLMALIDWTEKFHATGEGSAQHPRNCDTFIEWTKRVSYVKEADATACTTVVLCFRQALQPVQI